MGEASFWDAVEEGVLNVMNEGDELIFVEGEHGNAAGQVDIIEDFIAQGCDLVFFNPVDADAATSCLICWRRPASPSSTSTPPAPT